MDGGELIYLGEKAAWNDANGHSVYAKQGDLKKIQQYFSLVFQNFNLFPHYSVLKNIMDAPICVQTVSYTHLDVYKRQGLYAGEGDAVFRNVF